MFIKNQGIIFLSALLILATAPFLTATQASQATNTQQTETIPQDKVTQSDRIQSQQHHTSMLSKEDIRQIQMALRDRGFDPGRVDGVWGPKTRQALREFQMRNNLAATGALNRETLSALNVNIAPNRTAGVRSQQPSPHLGMSTTALDAEDVRKIQIALRNRGYDPGEINGMLSSQTQEAIRQFQQANNIPATGLLDEQTQLALGVSINGTVDSQRAKPRPGAQPGMAQQQPGMQQRQTGPEKRDQMGHHPGAMSPNAVVIVLPDAQMEQVRMALRQKGYDPDGPSMSAQMMDAIRRFQTANNIQATGHLDERTLSALGLRVEVRQQTMTPRDD